MELPVVNGRAPDQPWYAQGLRFACTQCGNCCTGAPGYVWISREEIARLAQHLSLTVERTIDLYCRGVGDRFSLKETFNPRHGGYDCVFLHERAAVSDGTKVAHTTRVCSVYAARPAQCRAWPFWASNLASPEAWELAAKRCPGIGRGDRHGLKEIESARDQTSASTPP
jgi:Fe-S-cluster containining protein